MEESKDLIVGYKIFRSLVYVSLILEFFLYAVDPAVLDFWGGILMDLHARMKRWFIYADGNLIWSKVATLLLICITCIGTRNKKKLEFDARKMVLYPLVSGLFIVVLSVWLFGHAMGPHIYTITTSRTSPSSSARRRSKTTTVSTSRCAITTRASSVTDG